MTTSKRARGKVGDKQPYARLHYCGHSPDPADYWWGVICQDATLDFDNKTTAQLVTAALNAAYQRGLAERKRR